MLAVSPLTSVKNERESEIQGFSMEENKFHEFASGNLLDNIDFDDIFVGISDGDVLPDLEMDQEIFADFSVSAGEESEMKMSSVADVKMERENNSENTAAESISVSLSDVGMGSSSLNQGEEIVSEREESAVNNPSPKGADRSRKSSSRSRNPPGKKKPKVDWTPELHRRFVQAVEQLGLDKAVPSRILEIMGIDSLTRHNIASHLQKYRSHRKHLLAREAEAARWSQRRQMYGAPPAAGVGAAKPEVNPWIIAPTIGFPPLTPMPHFRPLHVWGHPSVDQSLMPMWPKHVAPPPHAWPPPHSLPPSPPMDPSFWHSHGQYVPTAGTPCFPPHVPPTRFLSPPVAGVPPSQMCRVEPGIGASAAQTPPKPPSDVHPSKESIDAAIGDVLTKPSLPLPIGLKPPSMDSVMAELQRQGISKIPPTSS